MKLSTALQKSAFWVSTVTFTLLPLFFLPLTSEFYEFNKQILLYVTAGILLFLWAGTFIADKQVRITRSPFGLTLIAILATWLASTFFKTPNRFDDFLIPGNTGSLLALTIIFFASTSLIRSRKELEILISGVVGSISILALTTILWGTNLVPNFIPFPFLKFNLWSPTGSPLASLVLFATILPFLVLHIIKEKTATAKTLFYAISLLLCVIATGIYGYRLFRPGSPNTPVFMPLSSSWAISLEALKTSPLLGTGPSTYLYDFTKFRPITANLSKSWNIRFATASNQYLHILTTVGFLGIITYLILIQKVFSTFTKIIKTSSESPLYTTVVATGISLFVVFASQFLTASNLTTTSYIYILLTILVLSLKHLGSSFVHEANIDIVAATETGTRTPLLPSSLFVLILLFVSPSMYLVGRAYWGEILFQKALTAAAQNNGKLTYDTLIAAISVNPFVDSYRSAYSQANFLIANAIASKTDLKEDDRNTITQLIQQAIRESKNAVSLNPTKVANVENMAGMYRNLLNFAEGADAWTLASYQQAITLDPTNPNLRISLGGLFYAAKNYDEAIRIFQQAVDLKPDLANARYNLAAAYREKGEYLKAYETMQSVLNLIDRSTPDFTKAETELEDLKKKIGQTTNPTPSQATAAKSELETAKPLPSPKIKPPLDLPSELGPTPQP